MPMPNRPMKFRHRTDWRGRLILQAFIDPQGNCDKDLDKGYVSMFAHWRDARASDITWGDAPTPPTK